MHIFQIDGTLTRSSSYSLVNPGHCLGLMVRSEALTVGSRSRVTPCSKEPYADRRFADAQLLRDLCRGNSTQTLLKQFSVGGAAKIE